MLAETISIKKLFHTSEYDIYNTSNSSY